MTTTKELNKLPVGLHNVGIPNLYLQVTQNKQSGVIRRSWIYRYRSRWGKTLSMGLGSFKAISLKSAKELAEEAAKVRLKPTELGEDPLRNKRFAKLEAKELYHKEKRAIPAHISLEQVTNEYLDNAKNLSDGYIEKWKRTFSNHLYPQLKGSIADLTKDEISKVLKPVFNTVPGQAKKLQQQLQVIFDYSVHKGYMTTNPAKWDGNLEFEFKNNSHKTQHMASLPYKDAPALFDTVILIDGIPSRALRFLMLTAVRANEALNAEWSEFDLDNKVWTIPASRMKMKREHKVPLSDAAIQLLGMGREITRHSKYVFPNRKGEPIAGATIRLLKDTINPHITIHGLRSTFKTWASEQTDFPNEISELALAHQISSQTERAYKRTTLFDKRRELMDQWAKYLTHPVP